MPEEWITTAEATANTGAKKAPVYKAGLFWYYSLMTQWLTI